MFLRTGNSTLMFLNNTDGNYTEMIYNETDYDAQFEEDVKGWIEWFISFWW